MMLFKADDDCVVCPKEWLLPTAVSERPRLPEEPEALANASADFDCAGRCLGRMPPTTDGPARSELGPELIVPPTAFLPTPRAKRTHVSELRHSTMGFGTYGVQPRKWIRFRPWTEHQVDLRLTRRYVEQALGQGLYPFRLAVFPVQSG